MSKVVQITNVNEYKKFKENNRRGVILYGAKWCHACEDIKPLYVRIANRYYKKIAMAYVDIEKCNLDFSKVPVLNSFYRGKITNSMEGASKSGLKEFIKDAIEYKHTTR